MTPTNLSNQTTLDSSKKGDVPLWGIIMGAVLLLIILSLVSGAWSPMLARTTDTAKALGECEGLGGVCMELCTTEYPPVGGIKSTTKGTALSLGCKNDQVCCYPTKFNNVLLLYKPEGASEFKPLSNNRSVKIDGTKKVYLDFSVTNQKNAGYCMFTFRQGSGTPVESGAGTIIKPTPGPNGDFAPNGMCPDDTDDYFFVIDSLQSPITVSLDVYPFKPTDPSGAITVPSIKTVSATLRP